MTFTKFNNKISTSKVQYFFVSCFVFKQEVERNNETQIKLRLLKRKKNS